VNKLQVSIEPGPLADVARLCKVEGVHTFETLRSTLAGFTSGNVIEGGQVLVRKPEGSYLVIARYVELARGGAQ
jgi:hypothetical protein